MIDLTTPSQSPLRCRDDDCQAGWTGPDGFYLVTASIDGHQFHGPAVFVCGGHRADAERALPEHMAATETRRWTVETQRIQNGGDNTTEETGPTVPHTIASGGQDPQPGLF